MINDITDLWINNAKPSKGNIKFLNYVISRDGERFDSSNAILDFNVDDDIAVGSWFRNNFWGNCRFQPAIVYPQGKRSADLKIFGKCPLIDGDTIEIKIIGSVRKDGLIKRIKQAYGQSENVLVDVSNYPFDENTIRYLLLSFIEKHDWIKLVAVKKDDALLFVLKKEK